MHTRMNPTLGSIRKLMPRWAMTYRQALRAAEKQATRLARAWQAENRAISEKDITSLTRMLIVRNDDEQRAHACHSGSCRYEKGKWVIWLDPTETAARQRFTLAHELKHILDSGSLIEMIYRRLSAEEIERVCDHFAASLLMSKLAVYHLWGDGLRTPEALAMACHVSVSAMRRRMDALGLPTDLDEPVIEGYTDAFPPLHISDTLPGSFNQDAANVVTPGATI
ncbi:ImmA/IrrE family metallo-endopeptidase [Rhodococcus qingshengii]|uniref:ImmA/IrrE family metallo-endopeptidase n=3 Tax=Bacillati TaxID=1783272 RepID=UPI0036F5645F